jgi:hypothetical protein
MKMLHSSLLILLFLMLSLAGCGSGGGDSVGANGTASSTVGVVKLAWDAPRNSDGTLASNISGYYVHFGNSSGNYDKKINNGQNTTCSVNGLASGTYYFAVSSYDSSGNESTLSNEVSTSVQ